MRRKTKIASHGKRVFAGVMAAAMLATTAAPGTLAYAEEVPAAQIVAEEEQVQAAEETAAESETPESADSFAEEAASEETADSAGSEETADSEQPAESETLDPEENTAEESNEAAQEAEEKTKVLQARIDALPTAEEFEAMADGTSVEDSTLNGVQMDVYNEAQAIADALEQLSEEEQAQIDTAKLEALFEYFNRMTAETATTITPSSVGSYSYYISSGGTYTVSGGTYYTSASSIIINTTAAVTLNIDGDITATASSKAFIYVQSTCSNLTINGNGHTVKNTGGSNAVAVGSYAATINVKNGTYGALASGSAPVLAGTKATYKVENSIIDGGGNGIYVGHLTVTNTTIQNSKIGMTGADMTAINCTFNNCNKAIDIWNGDNVKLSGTTVFSGNTDDIYLRAKAVVTLANDYDGNAKVTTADTISANTKRQITTAGTSASMLSKLTSANSAYTVNYDANGKYLYLWKHSHTWDYSASGSTVTAKCTSDADCGYAGGLALTLTAPDMQYSGAAYNGASVSNDITSVTGASAGNIEYYSGSNKISVPTNVGSYTAKVTIGGATATANFKITKAKVAKPSEDTTLFVYNGSEKTYTVASDSHYTVSGNTQINAGSYTVTVALTDKTNYEWADGTTENVQFDFVIAQAENAWVKAPAIAGWIYGSEANTPEGAAKFGTVSVSYAKKGEKEFSPEVPSEMGDYTARFTVEGNSNYTGLIKDVAFSISAKAMTVTASDYNGTYDGSAHSIAVRVINPEKGYSITYSTEENGEYTEQQPAFTDVGEYTVYYRVTAGNYDDFNGSATVKITGADFAADSIKAAGYNGTYDSKAHEITVSAPVGASVTYSNEQNGEYTAAQPKMKNTGEYTVYYKVSKKGYNDATGSATVTIAKKAVTAAVFAENKVYDGNTAATVTATANTGIAGETLTISGLSGKFADKNAGESKTVTVSGTMTVTAGANTNANNYDVTYADTTTADITAKEITVAITTNGGTYGNVKAAEAELSGAVDGDKVPVTLTYDGSETVPANAGSYKIAASIDNSNYKLTGNTEATFVIEKAVVNAPQISGKVYNSENQTADVSDTALYTVTKNDGGTSVGTYPVELTLKDANNYKWATTEEAVLSLTFTIYKAENEWTTTPKIDGWTYGDTAAQPIAAAKYGEYTVTYAANGSDTFTDEVPTNAGSYTARFTVADTTDYAGLTATVDFEIAPKAVTVSGITANDKAYDGTTDATLDFSNAEFAGILESDKLTVTATGKFAEAKAGKWEVSISDLKLGGESVANYVLAANGNQTETTATITAKQITVTITAGASGTYGETITPATATPNDVVGEDTPEITLTYTGTANDGTEYNSTEVPTKAGTYTVTATTTDHNYTLEPKTTTADFTIAKRPATVTPEDKSKVYEETDPELTYKVEGVLDGEELTGVTLARAEGENAGEYAITAKADEAKNPNYDVTFAKGKFTIEPKSIDGAKVVLGKGLTANGEEQTQTVEKVLLNDKEIPADSYTVTANTATNPGSYTLTITAKGNYTGSIKWTYVIAPAKAEDAPGADITIGSGKVKVVVQTEGNVPTTTLLTDKAELLAMLVDSGDITADELAQIANGASVDLVLTVKEANVNEETKQLMEQGANGYTIGQYLDIGLVKYMTVNGVQQPGVALEKTKDALTICVQVPEALWNTNGKVNRAYAIVREHSGEITIVDAAFDAENKTLTFETNLFSNYAIAYKDTAVPSKGSSSGSSKNDAQNETEQETQTAAQASGDTAQAVLLKAPRTGDASRLALYAAVLAADLACIAGMVLCRKKNHK